MNRLESTATQYTGGHSSANLTPDQQLPLAGMLRNKMVFFSGYPGSGKGTQGKKICDLFQVIHLSTGELFRAEANSDSEIGLKMGHYMDLGQIIPQELTFEYLRSELSKPKYRNGFVLDGYPKDEVCFNFIVRTLNELQYDPAIAFHFDIDRITVENRLINRLHCNACELDYNKEVTKPKVEGECDDCHGPLKARKDDTTQAIEKRLTVFEKSTQAVLPKFQEMGILAGLNAAEHPEKVTEAIVAKICAISEKEMLRGGSYFLRIPKFGRENTAVFHNHIDAENHRTLREIVSKIEDCSLDFQNKIYPVSHLVLGPQVTDERFASVYQSLPNFHSIVNATEEAFSTGKMGDEGFNYEQVKRTLKTAFKYPNHGVMTELEEDIYEKVFDASGKSEVTLDRGLTPYTIDWSKISKWKDKQIANIPRFELHHGFDLPKVSDEENLPIDLATLCKTTEEMGFSNGGWFVFRKENIWAYRSNEFSNEEYAQCMEKLNRQADQLRGIVKQMLTAERSFTSNCSLEKVHAIWRV